LPRHISEHSYSGHGKIEARVVSGGYRDWGARGPNHLCGALFENYLLTKRILPVLFSEIVMPQGCALHITIKTRHTER